MKELINQHVSKKVYDQVAVILTKKIRATEERLERGLFNTISLSNKVEVIKLVEKIKSLRKMREKISSQSLYLDEVDIEKLSVDLVSGYFNSEDLKDEISKELKENEKMYHQQNTVAMR